ncbi:MAG: hypothetical protein ABJN57_09355 [Hyphomicrobiales bacterium]
MAEDGTVLEYNSDSIERVIQNSQTELSDLLHKFKVNNDAIKHLAIYGLSGGLLAHSPDEETQNKKLLTEQYRWLSATVSPAINSINSARANYKKSRRRVTKDFGLPKTIRIQTEDADAISQIYASPIDPKSLIFILMTTRTASRRNTYVINEVILLDDLNNLSEEILKFEKLKVLVK